MRAARFIKNFALIFLCTTALAQSPASENKHFTKDGLSFDYPNGWALTDKSNPQAQHLILTRNGSSALIMVIAHRDLISGPEQLVAARAAITIPFVENVAQKLGVKEIPVWLNSNCVKVGNHSAVGFVLHGRSGKEPTTGEIYTLAPGRRFVNLVYIRAEKDDPADSPAWQAVRDSLKIAGPANSDDLERLLGAGVLNGSALELPKPHYPEDVYRNGISGTVTVQVTIDETGKVYSARAISGPVPLRLVSTQAALRAKFSPTILCGAAVKVIGIITYNFIG
jgi:TonB family protein